MFGRVVKVIVYGVVVAAAVFFVFTRLSDLESLVSQIEERQKKVKPIIPFSSPTQFRPKSSPVQPSSDVENDYSWRAVQTLAEDTVVQIFSYTNVFNWFEPYKTPEQKTLAGSGFFIDEKGHIVSNYHVIEGAVSIKIQIPSLGLERFDASVVGTSPERDVTLLKLTDRSLKRINKKLPRIPFLPLGDSDTIMRTQEILSLGYPLGQEKLKSTHGIVSGRERIGSESYIQITAPLNTGNSGGPSLNQQGEVIGINTAGVQSAQNVGYIIPISDVKTILNRLYKEKVARRPFLGVEINYSTQAMLSHLDNPEPGGVYISRVFEETPFERLGVQEGDMLYELNGLKIDRFGETSVPWSEDKVSIVDLVNRLDINQPLDVVIYRNGVKKHFTGDLILGDELAVRRRYPEFEKIDFEIFGGMVLMPLTLNHAVQLVKKKPHFITYEKIKNRYNAKLLLSHVLPNSVAHRTRTLERGHIIEEVNGRPVSTLKDFRDAIRTYTYNGFVSIKTEEKKFAVLATKELLKEEEILSHIYFFEPSALLSAL